MRKELAFMIFCLESYKVYRRLSGEAAAKIFRDYGVFDYVLEFYDVLHTTGHNYINKDIDRFLQARGAAIN